ERSRAPRAARRSGPQRPHRAEQPLEPLSCSFISFCVVSITTRIEQADGRAIVVKEAHGDDAPRLRAEGERTAAAAHPGVITVVSSAGDDHRWELRLAHGGRPLDVVARLDATALAEVMAAVATTL